MRAAVTAERSDSFLVAEHVHDYTSDLPGDGWHGVMNYSGFTKPVWTWLRNHDREAGFLGAPVVVPQLPAESMVETMLDFTSRIGWDELCSSWNLLGSHDTTRIRTLVGPDSRLVDIAAGLLFALPATPMLTYGDEIGMEGAFGEDGRRPMPWDQTSWDLRLLEVYRTLIRVRRDSLALREGACGSSTPTGTPSSSSASTRRRPPSSMSPAPPTTPSSCPSPRWRASRARPPHTGRSPSSPAAS